MNDPKHYMDCKRGQVGLALVMPVSWLMGTHTISECVKFTLQEVVGRVQARVPDNRPRCHKNCTLIGVPYLRDHVRIYLCCLCHLCSDLWLMPFYLQCILYLTSRELWRVKGPTQPSRITPGSILRITPGSLGKLYIGTKNQTKVGHVESKHVTPVLCLWPCGHFGVNKKSSQKLICIQFSHFSLI